MTLFFALVEQFPLFYFLLSTFCLPSHQEIFQAQTVRPLPGKLDHIPVFNSNSPELVINEGILLSNFPSVGKVSPASHLNFPLQGRFDIFAHHVAKATSPTDLRTLYLGIILSNPGRKPVTVDILQAASYLSQPDAPFIELSSQVEDPQGTVYAGPGSRVMGDILRNRRQTGFLEKIVIPAQESRMLLNLPIPVRDLDPPINGRSTYVRLKSTGKVYVASLARFAPVDGNGDGKEGAPSLEDWETLLEKGNLVTPRDRAPTPPGAAGQIIYGRVAGVAQGSVWNARLADRNSFNLSIPAPGQAISYGISTLPGGTLGTNQNQSAPLLVRYRDTAYQAHGNYGVQYRLTLPLYNSTQAAKTVTVSLQTPIKQDQIQGGLRFLKPPEPQVFFRGTLQVGYQDDQKKWLTRYFHLVQRRGQQGEPLVTLTIAPRMQRVVKVDLLYPPDATPPQVLTLKTL